MATTTRVSLPLLFLAFSVAAAAQPTRPLATLELEELMQLEVPSVFGPSKFLQTVLDAPAAVSLVTAQEIETHGYRTLAEIIQTAPGFNVTYDRNYTYMGVRGFQRLGDYNSRVLVLVDGHRTNDPLYDMAYVGTEFPIDVQLIDRIELIRGPGASIYGTNAFFAVVNVITRKGESVGRWQASADAGSLHTWAGRATFGVATAGGWDVLLSSSRYASRGQQRLYFAEYDDPATHGGIAEHMDADSTVHLFGSASFKGFSIQGVYGSRTKTVPTASYDAWFNDRRYRTTDAQGWIDLRYVHNLRTQTTVTSRLHYDRADYDGRFPWNASDTDEPSVGVFGDYGHASWWGASVDVNTRIAARHTVTAGAEYRNNFKLDQGGFDEATGIVSLDDRRSSQYGSLFVEDQFAIHAKLRLTASVRTDRYAGFGSTTNPRLALIFSPAPKTAIKFLWATAFRAPNAYERFYADDLSIPNPDLSPETIRTGEVVVERFFADRYRIVTSAYTSRIRGLISQTVDPGGRLMFQNLDAASTRGVEAEVTGRWPSGLAGRVSYSYQRATDSLTRKPLVNSARHLATATVTVPVFRRRVFAGIGLRAVGQVETLDGSFADSFVVPNLTVTARNLRGGLSVSASGYNLFKRRYGYPGGGEHRQNIITQDGRTFRVGLTYAWRSTK